MDGWIQTGGGGRGNPARDVEFDSVETVKFAPGRDSADTVGADGPGLGRIDQYRLVRKLGTGAFGVVYLARDTLSPTLVAIKTLHPRLKSNEDELGRVRENFALVQRLQHRNIAGARTLHRVGEADVRDETARRDLDLAPGDAVMLLTYAPGRTLGEWRRLHFAADGGRLPLEAALPLCRQIADALDYAHAERVVHRDMKPGNVMVEDTDSGPFVRVLDFGLAAEIRSSMGRMSRDRGSTGGTRPYMAPEQWMGRVQDGRADQYALAVMLYELLSGQPPFASVFATNDPSVESLAVRTQAPDPIPGVSRSVNAALLRALEKEPAARYPSCMEFIDAVSDAVSGSSPEDVSDSGAPLSGKDLQLLRDFSREFAGSRRSSRLAAPAALLESARWEKPAVRALRDLTMALLDEFLEYNASSALMRPLPPLLSGRGARLLQGLLGIPERRRSPLQNELVRFLSAADRFCR